MAYTRTPVAATDAFDLDALKLHARVDFDDDDAGLTLMGRTATAEIEATCDIALLRQTISLAIEAEGEPLSLPVGPLAPSAVVTINSTPVSGAVSSGRYPVLTLPDAYTGSVAVTYQAGYGDAVEDIPADLQLAVIDHASRLYDVRGADEKQRQGLSMAAARIAARYRQVRA